jgi:hypothetical protein
MEITVGLQDTADSELNTAKQGVNDEKASLQEKKSEL